MEFILLVGLGIAIGWWIQKRQQKPKQKSGACRHEWDGFLVRKCKSCQIEDWSPFAPDNG